MERLFFIVMIITFLVGCSKNETIPIISITDKTHEVISNQMNQDDDSLVWTEVQSNNHITVELSDSGEWSQQERTFLGEMIGSWLSEYTGEIINLTITDDDNQRKSDQEESFSIDLTGRTTYRSSSLISVVFQGMIHFKQTAHPNQVFFSVNFDPKTMKQVPFASL